MGLILSTIEMKCIKIRGVLKLLNKALFRVKMIRKFFFISVKVKFVTMNFFPSYEELGDIISTSQIVALKLFFLEPKY